MAVQFCCGEWRFTEKKEDKVVSHVCVMGWKIVTVHCVFFSSKIIRLTILIRNRKVCSFLSKKKKSLFFL